MRLAIMQGQAAVLDPEENLDAITAAARQAVAGGAELLLTPELFSVGYAPARIRAEFDPQTLPELREHLSSIARKVGIGLLYSLPDLAENGDLHISATLLNSEGEQLLHYRKVHLFGPEEQAAFIPGTQPPAVVPFGDFNVSVLICFDVEFPETVRMAALKGADLLLVPTALEAGYAKIQQKVIPTRALESQLYVAYANHFGSEDGLKMGGLSVLAAPDGHLIAEAGDSEELLIVDIDPAQVAAARADVPYLAERRGDLYREWFGLKIKD